MFWRDLVFNAFDYFNLPLQFALDEQLLEKVYIAKQKEVHPDIVSNRNDDKKGVLLNQAYALLKNPVTRAAHLLTLEGQAVPGQEGSAILDPQFLELMLEFQENLKASESPKQLLQLSKEVMQNTVKYQQAFDLAWKQKNWAECQQSYLYMCYFQKLNKDVKDQLKKLSVHHIF